MSKFLGVNGVKLHYRKWGHETAPPILLLHPAPLNAHFWDAFAPAMAGGYRVIAPDTRGFGDSQWSDTYGDDIFIDDLRGLIGALGLKRLTLCGNSMGGTLAYTYASLYPQEVDRLILVDTGAGEKPSESSSPVNSLGAKPGGPPPMPAGPFKSIEDAAAQVPRVFGPAFARFMVERNLKRDAEGQYIWKYDHKGLTPAGERSMRDMRKWSRWLSVKCPTLVMRGERSPALPQRIADQMAAENKNASVIVVPGAGHFIPIEQPEAFEAAVRRWLAVTG